MDFKQIQELVKLVNKSNIGELTIEQKDFKISIKQKEDHITQVVAPANFPIQNYAPSPSVLPQHVASNVIVEDKADAKDIPSNLVTIKSPMIGTFYRKPSPDKQNFVDEGDSITPGKVICVIEAMKLFNEIESEVSGRIVKVLVDDASPVEFDQPLFLVEP